MKVTAHAVRSQGWWVVEVPEVDGAFTQARRLDQVPAMVRDAVALLEDVPAASIEVDLVPVVDDEVTAVLQIVREQRAESDQLARSASNLVTALATLLSTKQGYSLRDIGVILGISHQRVAQIIKAPADQPHEAQGDEISITQALLATPEEIAGRCIAEVPMGGARSRSGPSDRRPSKSAAARSGAKN